MADFWLLLTVLFSLSFIFLIFLFLSPITTTSSRRSTINLPPSSFQLPFIGHLYLIRYPLAQCLHGLSLRLGPVFSLRFGSRLVVVISSAAAAEDCFARNDIVLANRPRLLLGEHVAYNCSTLVTAPYGESWRRLRKTCSAEILSPTRLAQFSSSRKYAVEKLIRGVARVVGSDGGTAAVVLLRPLLKELMLDVLMKMIAGEQLGSDSPEFLETICEVLKEADTANPADFVPVLRWFDLGGYQKRIEKLAKKADELLQGLVDEKRSRRTVGGGIAGDNMLDHLLNLQGSEPEFYTDVMMKGLILDLLAAGTDTSSVTIEWAMSLLLNHPDILHKAINEIDSQIGHLHPVDESDLPNLPFLQSIVSETLRLYTPTPLLLPHFSSQECTVSGFRVPRETIVFVNAWAIHRDQSRWVDPLSFRPERFEGRDVDSWKFLPFGIGRRACPGSGLASRVVCLALASLIQCFEWERVSEEEVDMREGEGLTMPMATPLEALCKARPIMSDFLCKNAGFDFI